jgi:hypothetical protein
MSNKNINESLRDAWQKSIQNGDTIRSIRQKEKDQIDSIVEDKRNNVLSHLTENDKGFYRPETSPYHKFMLVQQMKRNERRKKPRIRRPLIRLRKRKKNLKRENPET